MKNVSKLSVALLLFVFAIASAFTTAPAARVAGKSVLVNGWTHPVGQPCKTSIQCYDSGTDACTDPINALPVFAKTSPTQCPMPLFRIPN